MIKTISVMMIFVIGAMLFIATSAYGLTVTALNITKANKPNVANTTATRPVIQQGTRASFPSLIVFVDLGMHNKNINNYGIVDVTVTLKNVTKTHTLNTTSFPGDRSAIPFRFSPKNDNIPIQIGDKYTACASGEFLNVAVCQTGMIKTKAPPISRTNIELG